MRFRGMSVLVVGAALAISGCGSSSSTSSSPAGTGSSPTTSTGASTAPTGTSGSFASGNCQQLVTLRAKFLQALSAAQSGGKYNLQALAQAYQSLANEAPDAIKADLQLVAQAFSSFAAQLAKIGYNPGTPPTQAQLAALQKAVTVFETPQIQAASKRISAWVKANCGNLVPKTSTG